MKKQIVIPTLISSVRIAILPLFYYFYSPANPGPCLILLVFSAASDFLDGFSARKLKAATMFGTYFDATTDFVLTFGVFAFFTDKGLYPIWLPLLIATSFFQFLLTSHYAKKIYDPVGKYIGSALYIGIVLTLVFPSKSIYSFVQYAFVVFFLVSLASRITSLARKRDNKLEKRN